MTLFKRRYGAGLLHLLGHVAAFGLAGFALAQIVSGGAWVNFVAWFGGAAILHDLVLLPVYSALDRIHLRLHKPAPVLGGKHSPPPRPPVPVINHVRVPALISSLLLLVYFPLILGTAPRTYLAATGHHLHGYLRNWLLITAGLFAASAAVYGLRILIARRRP